MTADPNRLMRDAEAHFVAGRNAEGRGLIEQVLRIVPGHPAVLHLYGLILSRLDDLQGARRALEAAQRGLPNDPQVANNLGNLLDKLGEREAALSAYETAIRVNPGFAQARLNRAITLEELGRHQEARAELEALARLGPLSADALVAFASVERSDGDLRAAARCLDDALKLVPGHRLASHGRARIAADIGEAGAAGRYRAALAEEPENRELMLGYVAAAQSEADRHEALERVKRAIAADPAWYEGHRELSKALWESGRRERFAESYETATAARPQDKALWAQYIEAFGRIDDHIAAAELCARAERTTGDSAFASAAFSFLSAAGRIDEADSVLARLPGEAIKPIALAKHRLRQRDPAAAEPLLAAATASDPEDIEAWALRGIAWKLLGDARFDWLNGQPGLLAVHELPISGEQIAAIVDRLRTIHIGSTIRAGQSVRGGTQTAGDIFDRPEPEIVLLRDTLREAVERHRAAMPPTDPLHPILRHRDDKLAFAGSWSVRLTGGGFHVQHIHPKGLFSAASYWAVPDAPADDPHAGWLEIGGAPAYLALDFEPMSLVEPRPGRLALFPSTLHHGTRPFPGGERISVAFDVIAR